MNKKIKVSKINLFVTRITFLCFISYFLYGLYKENTSTELPSYSVCFTPPENCAIKIIEEISGAKQQILVQAYYFTDLDIAHALVLASTRGVVVRVILDKTQLKHKAAVTDYLKQNGIEILIDKKPVIAHNKIIIIDDSVVITGSYNYTYSAKSKNAENLLVIRDAELTSKYIQNWYFRAKVGTSI